MSRPQDISSGSLKASGYQAVTAGSADEGRRLDQFLADRVPELSRSRVQKLLEEEKVQVNREPCSDKNYRLRAGDRVGVTLPPAEDSDLEPEAIALDIIYEDDDLVAINKPRGMVVHPAPGHSRGTLVNALLHHCPNLSGVGGIRRPGIVHRLDKNTSGLLLVAKNDFTHRALSAQLKSRQLKREYIALVAGRVKPLLGRVEAPIARHPHHRKKMAVVAGGRPAVTRYRGLKYYGRYSLIRLNLETGRTHQIRVHMSHLGYPVVGDPTYAAGGWKELPESLAAPQALHACRLQLIHPRTARVLELTAPLPPSFKKVLHHLKAISVSPEEGPSGR